MFKINFKSLTILSYLTNPFCSVLVFFLLWEYRYHFFYLNAGWELYSLNLCKTTIIPLIQFYAISFPPPVLIKRRLSLEAGGVLELEASVMGGPGKGRGIMVMGMMAVVEEPLAPLVRDSLAVVPGCRLPISGTGLRGHSTQQPTGAAVLTLTSLKPKHTPAKKQASHPQEGLSASYTEGGQSIRRKSSWTGVKRKKSHHTLGITQVLPLQQITCQKIMVWLSSTTKGISIFFVLIIHI